MGKVISIIFIVLLAPVFFALIVILTLKLTVLNPNFIKNELSEHNAYEKIHANLLEVSTIVSEGDKAPEDQGALNENELVTTVQKAVPPEMAREKTEDFIDAFWPWLFSGKSKSTVDMRDFKNNLRTGIMDSFRSKYESLPYCVKSSDYSESNILCRVRGVSFDSAMAQLTQSPENNPLSFVDDIPDSISPETVFDGGEESSASVSPVRSIIESVLGLFYLYPIVLAVIFILFARLFGGSWKKTPQALGIFLIILGSLSLLSGFVITRLGFPKSSATVGRAVDSMPNLKSQLIVPLTDDILSRVGSTINLISLSVLIAGIILVVGSLIILKVASKDNPESQNG